MYFDNCTPPPQWIDALVSGRPTRHNVTVHVTTAGVKYFGYQYILVGVYYCIQKRSMFSSINLETCMDGAGWGGGGVLIWDHWKCGQASYLRALKGGPVLDCSWKTCIHAQNIRHSQLLPILVHYTNYGFDSSAHERKRGNIGYQIRQWTSNISE